MMFFWYERSRVKPPMLEFEMFNNRSVISGFFSALVDGVVLWTTPYFMILYFLIVRSHPLLLASVQTLPGIGSVPSSAAIAGIFMLTIHRFKYLTLLSWVLITNNATQVIIAVGGGILFPGRIYAVQAQQRSLSGISIVNGMAAFFASLGQVCGVSVGYAGGTVFQNRWKTLTQRYMDAGRIHSRFFIPAKDAEGTADTIKTLQVAARAAYQGVMAGSIKTVWTFLTVIPAAAFAASLMRDLKLDQNMLQDGKDNAERVALA
ncbi:uncharacterized protein Z519_05305 [Cladophialophora bantiana CBS 173.52]|uniref:Major facilitator superfamily (MFS) profile domain-containing protein n=1 Tax=Cladophialophora bantiana (strain ATCC 10958 / CBS 173.52 / CDC B-1940 / NIH 8579) TaxID=1442370 RepID=A0A0D2HT15_CLAB1|nr:uncharacterized protein Z519_05305 [Cladophialophora bantiana CBS 173.52]KIW93990.1 hypothetical protein Z519_05305 [Cladophialophora bantiana CBS 173.52]